MKKILLTFIAFVMLCNVQAQIAGNIALIDTVPDYYRSVSTPSTFYEYQETVVCIDSSDRISVISIENYELQLYESTDFGDTWTKTPLTTGEEGDLFVAMIACTPDGQRVIIYAYNPYMNYGQNLSTYNYFTLGTNALVETPTGWQKSTLSPVNSSNYGLIPFAIFTDRDGMVHAVLHRRGWYTYGGDIHESIYNPSTNTWSSVIQIYHYNQTIDRSTNYYAKIMQDPFGNLAIIYLKQRSDNSSKKELCLLWQNSGSWSGVSPVILDGDYDPAYWHYDIAEDGDSNMYFMMTTTSGPSGPRFILSRNSFLGGDTLYPFTANDTLLAAQFLEIRNSHLDPSILCYFKHTGKRYYSYDGSTFSQIPDVVFSEPGDSTSFYEYWHIPWVLPANKNFGTKEHCYLIHKEYQGTNPANPAHVLAMPFKFTRLWQLPPSTEAGIEKFTIPGQLGSFIDTTTKEILVVMPVGTNFAALTPDTIIVSPNATVNPAAGITQNFTNPVYYYVTAQDTNIQIAWQVTVIDNTGVEKFNPEKIRIYPNPVTDALFIETGQRPVNLALYDLSGNQLFTQEHFVTGSLSLSGISSGVYMLMVTCDNNRLIKRIVVL